MPEAGKGGGQGGYGPQDFSDIDKKTEGKIGCWQIFGPSPPLRGIGIQMD